MRKPDRKHRGTLGRVSPLSLFASECPKAMLAIGIVANFAWLTFLFWILSYWLAWR